MMLKLTVVSCGNRQRVTEYVRALKNDLYCFSKQYDFRVYSTNKIYSSETDVDVLKKRSRFSFPTHKDVTAEYWGIIGDANLSMYYARWFSKENVPFIPNKRIAYNKDNLKRLVNEWCDGADGVESFDLFDLRVKYQYYTDDNKDICLFEISLNDRDNYPNPKEVFRKLIIKMDKCYSDVFMSACVVHERTDLVNAHYQVGRYDLNLLDSKILGTGYMMYVSKKIETHNGFEGKNGFEQYTNSTLLNGTLCMRKGEWANYGVLCDSIDSVFYKMVIPQYRVFNWSDICNQKHFRVSASELVSVYYDKYSPNDPTVVFSYGYSCYQLNNLPILCGLMCQERYSVKELFESTD